MTDEPRPTKQVIVMRTDLNMRKGKMIAQGAHAAMAWLTSSSKVAVHHRAMKRMMDRSGLLKRLFRFEQTINNAQRIWLDTSFKKICVRVDSEAELQAVHMAALAVGLESHLITDSGLTEFNGIPTLTCCAIGPDYDDRIDAITGHLQLL